MNLDSLNKWLTLLGNLGVIAGIIFLAMELRQNTDMMESQTRDAMAEKQMDWYMSIGTNEFATQIFFDGADGVTNTTGSFPRAANSFSFMAQANLRMWENEWYQYNKGLYEEDEFLARSRIWPGVIAQPGYIRLWEINKSNFAPEFREYIDSLLNTQD